MTLKWTPERYPEYGIGCLSVPKKTKEKGSTFTPLYNGIKDSYGVDSIGYYWVIGVPKGHTTLAGDTKFSSNTHVTHWYTDIFTKACMEGRTYGRTIQSLNSYDSYQKINRINVRTELKYSMLIVVTQITIRKISSII